MLLRVLLSATLIANPIADALAMGPGSKPYATAFTAKNGASTRLAQTDAQDWIIEGVANRDLGNKDRARELFEAARERLDVDKIPEPYASEIHDRMNSLFVSVGGSATKHTVKEEVKPPVRIQTETCNTAMSRFDGNDSNNNEDIRTRTPGTNNATTNNPPCNVSMMAEGLSLDDLEVIPAEVQKPKGQLLIASPRLSLADLSRATSNSEVRALLWWITAGRIAFYAKDENLAQIIQRKVAPQDRLQIDNFRTGIGGYGGYGTDVSTGVVQEFMMSLGLFRDYTSEAHSLIQMFDGSKLGDMADRHVRDAMRYGGMLGGLFRIWSGAKRAGPTAGAGAAGDSSGGGFGASRFGGIGIGGGASRTKVLADSSLSFVNNASYMFKMAALYGVQLDQYQMQTIGLLMLAIVKGGLNLRGAQPRIFKSQGDVDKAVGPLGRVMSVMGRNFARASRSGRGGDFIETTANRVMGVVDDAAGASLPGGIGSSPVGNGFGTDPNGTGSTTTPPDDPNANNGANQPVKKKRVVKKLTTGQRALVLGGFLARGATGAALGAFEAGAVAKLSKYFFQGFYEDTIKLQNKSFIRILNSKKGFAFLKLLIHAMQLEEDSITRVDMKNKSAETQFILNLARTAGICSPEDYNKLEATKGQKTVSQDVRVLRFSCPSKRDTYYYDLLMREMMTFNAVKTKNLVRLRASILRDRLKMAQLLIQFQFVDGRQTQEEQEFFEDVTSKILGITSSEQRHYLDIFEGFVKQSDLIKSQYSPTGFAYTDRTHKDPYDNKSSPTPVNSPSQVLAVDWGDPGPSEDPGPWNSNSRFNTSW